MNIEKSTLKIGLEKPLKILHVTDNHLPLYDESDTPAIVEKGKKRNQEAALTALREEMAYGTEHCDLFVHSGDLIDFASSANVTFALDVLKNEKILFIAGNHEYWRFDGGIEDMNYRLAIWGQVKKLGVNLFFTSRAVGGVNFVGIDDAYHQVEAWQTERLHMEIEKGYLNDRGTQALSNLGDYPPWWEEMCLTGALGFKTNYAAAFTKWWFENNG